MDPETTRAVLRDVLAPVVVAGGCDLEDVTTSSAGRRRVVRAVVDRDGGVSLDAVAELSRAISAAMDADPRVDRALGGAPYVLEVSSPGAERSLTAGRHWRRAVGRRVHAVLTDGTEVTGRLQSVEPAAATDADVLDLRLLPDRGPERGLRTTDVARARVQVEFSRSEPAGAPTQEGR